MAWDAADLVERRAPAGRAQHLAAEMFCVAGNAVGLGFFVGLADHDLLAAEHFRRRGLRGSAGRDLDLQLGLEIADDLPGIGGAARQIDRHAAEHDDIAARRRHFARRAHADVVGLVDLVLAAHHDGERGDHERHAFRHDLVELVREHFGGERRRGVADASAAAVDVAAGLFRHCRAVLGFPLPASGERPAWGFLERAENSGPRTDGNTLHWITATDICTGRANHLKFQHLEEIAPLSRSTATSPIEAR